MNDTITTDIHELVTSLDTARKVRKAAADEAKERDGEHVRQIESIERHVELVASAPLSVEEIELARSVIALGGKIEESAEGAFEAALVAVAAGGKTLLKGYIGAKRYERFHQREDHVYGYGPKHGRIVFSIGLDPTVRRRPIGGVKDSSEPLSRAERSAAVRWLMAEKRLADERATSRRW